MVATLGELLVQAWPGIDGVMDPDDYDDIVLWNTTQKDFWVKRGDRIAQVVFDKFVDVSVLTKGRPPNLRKKRGGGFGSTGAAWPRTLRVKCNFE